MAQSTGIDAYDLHLKLLMLGDTGVGKTCMLLRYTSDTFRPTFITTIGIDFKIKIMNLEGQTVKLQIWDTAGQERFRTITVSYFKGAHGIILMYDVTDRETFESISHWVKAIKDHADAQVNVVLVGNKSDDSEKRQVTTDEGQGLANEYSLKFFETSAKHNLGVDETFEAIAKETKARMTQEPSMSGTNSTRSATSVGKAKPSKRSKCC